MALYISDLLSVAGCQLSGIKIADSPLVSFKILVCSDYHFNIKVNRLIEQRIVLERTRPLEEQMNYKIEKLVKMANDNLAEDDPLQAKPDIGNLDLGKYLCSDKV